MKKVFSVILSVLYFSLSTGASVSLHYCGGELESINLIKETNSCCCGLSEMSNTCCKNHQFVLDIDTDEDITLNTNLILNNLFLYTFLNYSIQYFNDIGIEKNHFVNYKIPPQKLEPIWLLNCSLTYYG